MDFLKLHYTRERPTEYDVAITSPNIVAQLIGNSDTEKCLALLLDTKGKINSLHLFAIGTLNESLMHPREVFKAAILTNANSIIIAHNHPSGDLEPSPEDIKITRRLIEAGKLLGIPVRDHVIVAGKEYYSMKEQKTLSF